MAKGGEIDTSVIGKVLKSIPYDSVIMQPLKAMISAQTLACQAALDFILKVGFETDDNGVRKATYAEFEFEETGPDGGVTTKKIKVPMLTIIPLPSVGLQEGVVHFSVEISQSASVSDKIDAGGEGSAKVGWGPFALNISAKASYSRESARKTDTRARQEVTVKVGPMPQTEGMEQVLEILREAALGAGNSGDAPTVEDGKPVAPSAPSGGGKKEDDKKEDDKKGGDKKKK